MSFVHLHTHSHFSLLDGLSKIDQLVEKAKASDMPALALTDHGAMYGVIEFYQAARAVGIKPILGVEAYVARRTIADRDPKLDAKPYHLTLLARTMEGYHNLTKLVSISHLEGMYYKPRIDHDLLKEYGRGLTILTGCLNGELARTILSDDKKAIQQVLDCYIDAVGREHVFLEIQHHPNLSEQQTVNAAIVTLSQQTSLPIVATADSHYVAHDDQAAHEVLLAVATGKDVDDSERMSLRDVDLSLATPEEMTIRFAGFPGAIANTLKVAEQVDLTFDWHNILPRFPLPKGKRSAQKYLEERVWTGRAHRYPKEETRVDERVRYELGVIEKMGFADYFLIVSDFVEWSKQQGIVVGPGRGSAAGSIIAYCLGITGLDPLRYGLLFERFLNPDRISMPDIDIDFADDRRDEVLRYVQRMYGEERVAQIITFGTMAARGSVRDVARALGMTFADGDRVAKLIPGKPGTTLRGSLDTVKDLKAMYDTEPPMTRLIDMAMKLEGVARHASTHACGVIIANAPLVEYLPLAANQKGPMRALTQFGMNDCETIGLLKMDFLGLSNLTIMKNALRIIRKRQTIEIDIDTLPLDDKLTYELLSRAETTGVFQLESEGMKRYLKELKPSEFEDIVAMCALYRPGPMDFIPDFIARKHGRKAIHYLHPSMEEVLKPTYGVMVYQEQIMKLSQILAGFTGGEADTLRKGVAKKIKKVLDKIEPKFLAGCQQVGFITQDQAKQLWQEWLAWAKYGFNKSHAACYAMIAYQTAYLKAHYPAEFMAALLTSDIHNLDRIGVEIAEAERMGLKILPPSVNESFTEFGVVTHPTTQGTDATNAHQTSDGTNRTSGSSKNDDRTAALQRVTIRFGLAAIKNVGQGVAEAIVEERTAHGHFPTLQDMLSRLPPKVLNRKALESLAMAGALDDLAERQQLLDNMDAILKFVAALLKERTSTQHSLFGDTLESKSHSLQLKLVASTPATKQQRLSWEKELLSVYVSEHPLDQYREKLEKLNTKLSQLSAQTHNQPVTVGGLVTDIRQITTKNGEPMAFVKLEDYTGTAELVLFPRTYKESASLWQPEQLLLVNGKVNERNGQKSILVDSARLLAQAVIRSKSIQRSSTERQSSASTPLPAVSKELHLILDGAVDRTTLELVKTALVSLPGETPVICTLIGSQSRRVTTDLRVDVSEQLMTTLTSQLGPQRILVVG
ncbi:DNA polymerase III subunit alpha [Candidatus Berkelbacteria bacterium]|nr:DNA polymerase III subunit alpha [Candidatus Berkelbacteria bacterium]